MKPVAALGERQAWLLDQVRAECLHLRFSQDGLAPWMLLGRQAALLALLLDVALHRSGADLEPFGDLDDVLAGSDAMHDADA